MIGLAKEVTDSMEQQRLEASKPISNAMIDRIESSERVMEDQLRNFYSALSQLQDKLSYLEQTIYSAAEKVGYQPGSPDPIVNPPVAMPPVAMPPAQAGLPSPEQIVAMQEEFKRRREGRLQRPGGVGFGPNPSDAI